LKYLADIKRFIHLLVESERFHLFTVMGAPGWAKTHGTRTTLAELGVNYQLLGSYATPLALFNKLAEDPKQTLVIDDCAGVFHNPQAMSILNAASWPSAEAEGRRRVIWTSTTEKAVTDSFDFQGKIIVLTNFIPETPQAKAFISRALHYRIEIDHESIGSHLREADKSKAHYPETKRALEVASFLSSHAHYHEPGKISLRTLDLGYELAALDPDN